MKLNLTQIVEQAQTQGHRLVASVIISYKEENQTFLLLLTRSARSSYAGSEEPPGGKIDANETVHQGAQREVFEETGITLTQELEFITWGDVPSKEKISRHFVFHARLTAKQTISLDPHEHSGYRWVNINELESTTLRLTLIEIIKENKKKF